MSTEPTPQTHTTTKLTEPGIGATAETKFQSIANKVKHFAVIKRIDDSEVSEALRDIYFDIKTSKNQVQTARQLLKNKGNNEANYSDLKDLVYNQIICTLKVYNT